MKKEQGDQLFWVWLSRRLGEGSRWYPLLLERFGTPYDVYKADEEETRALVPELTDGAHRALCDKRLDEAYQILEYSHRGGCSLLCYGDASYPLSYKSLPDPPLVLYYRGALPDFQNRLHIAVVGTRKMSEYGRRTAYKIAYELAHAGAVIVSGMALGIDSVAACAALEAGGDTVAILGCGIDICYPPQHASFQKTLEKRGTVMTEYAPGARPIGAHFPVRNRLISGLSQGTLVIDAKEGSGALITADRALLQGRAVFAVPANVGDPNAAGTNRLIRDGVRVVLCADDILQQFSLLYRHTVNATLSAALGERSDYDAQVLERMGVYSVTIDGEGEPPRKRSAPRSAAASDTKPKKERQQTAAEPSQAPEKTPDRTPDDSAQRLAALGERERAVFEHIPMDAPVALDRLQSLGYGVGELLAALSMLEIQGLIQTLPGGLYARA